MIRRTLAQAKLATWCVYARANPTAPTSAAPLPLGTAFAIHRDGFFLTARHVVVDTETGRPRQLENLMRPGATAMDFMAVAEGLSLVKDWSDYDLALLQVDRDRNARKDFLASGAGFPVLALTDALVEDGTPVYSYGFPLSPQVQTIDTGWAVIASVVLAPRVTSAIIASGTRTVGGFRTSGDARSYVTDKAFNYGNSGGPLVSQETGEVLGVVVEFQPNFIRQDPNPPIMVPSLYGIASAVSNVMGELGALLPA